jgi:hypothetical protein
VLRVTSSAGGEEGDQLVCDHRCGGGSIEDDGAREAIRASNVFEIG